MKIENPQNFSLMLNFSRIMENGGIHAIWVQTMRERESTDPIKTIWNYNLVGWERLRAGFPRRRWEDGRREIKDWKREGRTREGLCCLDIDWLREWGFGAWIGLWSCWWWCLWWWWWCWELSPRQTSKRKTRETWK